MKFAVPMLIAASLCLSPQASGKSVPAKRAPAPLLGTWALDIARMPLPPEYRPKQVTITFADAGAEKWTTRINIIGSDASVRNMTSLYSRQGIAVPIQGDQLEADTAAVVTPTPNIMVLALAKGGRPGSTRVYTVSNDGRSMIEEAVSYDDTGTPIIRTNHFSRVAG